MLIFQTSLNKQLLRLPPAKFQPPATRQPILRLPACPFRYFTATPSQYSSYPPTTTFYQYLMIKELLASASATRQDSSYPPASTPVTRLPVHQLPAYQNSSYPPASTPATRMPVQPHTWSKSCLPVVLGWMANSSSASMVVTRTLTGFGILSTTLLWLYKARGRWWGGGGGAAVRGG